MFKKIFTAVVLCAAIFVFVSFAKSEINKKKQDELFKQVELFSDSLAIIQEDYVDEVKFKDMIYGALKGMLASLDPHSQFMNPDEYNELKVDAEGKFGGLGIEITVKDGLLTIVTPIEDTPAWKEGLKSGDRIVKINNELTRDMTITEAVKKMRGVPGTSVGLTILRESEKRMIDFKITRDLIKIKDIKEAKILQDEVGYIRLVEFRENTAKDLDTAIKNLKKQRLSALILDLRNNPGGLLETAVGVTEKFIPEGKLIVQTKSRRQTQNLEFYAQEKNPLLDIPLVVLINEGSASGSEIVAGALQDYKRAIIVGVKSFGKGSVQSVFPLSDGSALRLTTSRYYTPLGREIHGKGVEPDIMVEEAQIEAKDKDEEEMKPEKIKDYKSDNQLMRAVDALKIIEIYKVYPSKINENKK